MINPLTTEQKQIFMTKLTELTSILEKDIEYAQANMRLGYLEEAYRSIKESLIKNVPSSNDTASPVIEEEPEVSGTIYTDSISEAEHRALAASALNGFLSALDGDVKRIQRLLGLNQVDEAVRLVEVSLMQSLSRLDKIAIPHKEDNYGSGLGFS